MESSAHNGTAAAHFPGLRPQAPEKPAGNDRSFKPRSEYLNVEAVNLPANRIMATTLSVANQHRFGELYVDFLRARKRVFIDHKKWDLPNTDGMEFDQYDTPQSSRGPDGPQAEHQRRQHAGRDHERQFRRVMGSGNRVLDGRPRVPRFAGCPDRVG